MTVDLFAPGLNVIRDEPFWIPTRDAIARGFQPKTVKLHYQIAITTTTTAYKVTGPRSELEAMARRCAVLKVEMDQWCADPEAQKIPVYTGTIKSLVSCYQRDPESAYQGLEQNTQACYDGWCRTLVRAVGERRVDRLTGRDMRKWFLTIMQPAEKGGKPRVRLAKGVVRQMMPILLGYGAELGFKNCAELLAVLEAMTLRVPRDIMNRWKAMKTPQIEMSFEQASAIVDHGLGKGTRRHRSVAITTAAQFEMTLTQIDVIGKVEKVAKARNLPAGAIVRDRFMWLGVLRYEDFLPGMTLDMTRSKNGNGAIFDLNEYPLFLRALAAVPEAERKGPVAITDEGEPFKKRWFHRVFTELAAAAGVPKGVWSMNARHGGGTESRKAGIPIEDTSEHLQHSNISTTKRHYIKGNVETTRRVARGRVGFRKITEANGQ